MTNINQFDAAPPWFKWALQELGVEETPGSKSTPRVIAYRDLGHVSIDGEDGEVPWCAIFANAALEACGVHGTRSAASQSFRGDPHFKRLDGPALGALAVFWRRSRTSGLGHVGFYRGESADGSRIYVLGGNEGDAVRIAPFPRSSASFGLIGYWWPAAIEVPRGAGRVVITAGAAAQATKVT